MTIPYADHLLASLQGVVWWALIAALVVHLFVIAFRARAWGNALNRTFPASLVRYKTALGAVAAGSAANTVIPARGGVLIKLSLARNAIPGSTYPALFASLLTLAVVDIALNWAFVVWGVMSGQLPAVRQVLTDPRVLGGLAVEHPTLITLLGAALIALLVVATILVLRHGSAWKCSFLSGLAAMRDWQFLLGRVWSWQLAAMVVQIASWWLFLVAFHAGASIERACLIQAVASLTAGLALLPGGGIVGQGMLVFALSGRVAVSRLLTLALGMRLSLAVVNVAFGFGTIGLIWHKGLSAFRRDPIIVPEPVLVTVTD